MARASRIAPSVARKLDRLARRVHAFHRFAHHPLCDAYAGELIALGKQRVCRGCTLLAGGSAAGFATGVSLQLSLGAWCLGAVVTLVPVVIALAEPRRFRSAAGKWLTRALPGFSLGLVAAAALRSQPTLLGLTAATLGAGVAWLWQRYRARGPDRSPCVQCPHLTEQPCPGFAPIVRAERTLQRRARQLLAQAPSVAAVSGPSLGRPASPPR